MLKVRYGSNQEYCDGVSRRSFLQLGALSVGSVAFGGLTLADLMRAEAASGAFRALSAGAPGSRVLTCLPPIRRPPPPAAGA